MAGNIRGIVIDIGGNTQPLQKAIKEVDKESRNLQKELRAVEKGLQFDPSNVELLKQKQELLTEAITNTARKLETLKSAQENASRQLENGEIGAEQYRELQRQIISTERELQNLNAMAAQSHRAFQEVGNALENAGQKMETAGSKLTASLSAPLALLGGAAVKTGADFDSSMSKVKAVSGAAGEEFDKLRGKAREMGASTSKTAAESADALSYMALAGWDTNQMLEGLEPILRASEASGGELAETSDLITDSMSAMGVQTDELNHYLDTYTQAQNNSNAGLLDFLTANIECGGSLKNLNVPLDESAALLGVLANRGKKGAEAGRALNSILVNLIGANSKAATAMNTLGVSAWDTNGNFIGVTETLKLLDNALNECTEEQKTLFEAQIGGKTQIDTLQALISGVNEEYNGLRDTIINCDGALLATAETMQDNLAGDFSKFKSEIADVGIEIGDILSPNIRKILKDITGLLGKFQNMDEGTKRLIIRFATFAATIGPVLLITGKLTTVSGQLIKKTGEIYSAVRMLITSLIAQKTSTDAATASTVALNAAQKANIILAVASAIAVLVSALVTYKMTAEDTTSVADKLNEKLEEQRQNYESVKESIEDTETAELAKLNTVEKTLPRLEELANKTNRTTEENSELYYIIERLNEAMPDLRLNIDDETGSLNMNTDAIKDNIEACKNLAKAKAAQDYLVEAEKNRLKAEKTKNELEKEKNKNREEQNKIKEDLKKEYGEDAILNATAPPKIAIDNGGAIAVGFKLNSGLNQDMINQEYGKIIDISLQSTRKEYDELTKGIGEAQKEIDASEKDIDYWVKKVEELSPKTAPKEKEEKKKEKSNNSSNDKKEDKTASTQNDYEKQLKEREKARQEAIKEQISILDYQYQMGIIGQEEYFNSLKDIRDNNYEVMTSDWRSLTTKISSIQDKIYTNSLDKQESKSKKYIEKMNNSDLWGEDNAGAAYGRILERYKNAMKDINNIAFESAAKREEYEKYLTNKIEEYTKLQKQAYESAYTSKYNFSSSWIDDRNFYGDWESYNDNETEAWKRVKDAANKAYQEGQIDYKKYTEQIKAIDKKLYSASKTMAEKLVSRMKENEKAKLDAVKNRIESEKKLLQDSYNAEDREERLKKLYTQEKYYKNSLTKEGQDKYNSIIADIKQLEREDNILSIEKKADEEVKAAEQRYSEFEQSEEELIQGFIKKLTERNSIVIEKQQESLIKADEEAIEFINNQADNMKGITQTVGESINDIFKSYSDAQKNYFEEQYKKIKEYRKKIALMASCLSAIAASGIVGTNMNTVNNKSETATYHYNHYGDYKFENKNDINQYNKEANSNMFSVFGK